MQGNLASIREPKLRRWTNHPKLVTYVKPHGKRSHMAYTLGQAAKASGRSKAGIAQAIAAGRIAAMKDEIGRWQIEAAELHRVYPAKGQARTEIEQLLDAKWTAEIGRLKATVEGLESLCRQVEGERDNLRNQNARLTGLLTDQRVNPEPEKPRWRWWGLG